MRFRLIAADLDDTLLDKNSLISVRNKNAIQEAVSSGVKFTIATGRMFKTSISYMQDLGLNCDWPLINCHGALIKTAQSRKIILDRSLDNNIAITVIDEAKKFEFHIGIFVDDEMYICEENEYSRYYQTLTNIVPQQVGDLQYFLKQKGIRPNKISLISWDGYVDQLEFKLKARFGEKLSILQSRPYFLEVTDKRATKGQALQWLVEQNGLRAEEVIAFGDGLNDLDMVTYAGLGVAVGNARPAVLKAAGLIAAPHYEDGVAEVIEKYVLNHSK